MAEDNDDQPVEVVYLNDLASEMGGALESLLLNVPFVLPPDDSPPVILEVFHRPIHNKCMHCEGQLEGETSVVANESGILAVFCSTACLQDINVIGWIEEVHDDLKSAAKFRGGSGDVVEEEEK